LALRRGFYISVTVCSWFVSPAAMLIEFGSRAVYEPEIKERFSPGTKDERVSRHNTRAYHGVSRLPHRDSSTPHFDDRHTTTIVA